MCPDLNTPINGATVCDLWAYGRQCQIQCQDGFDFADGFPEVYVCGTNTGEWFPRDDVPDCTSEFDTCHNKHTHYTHTCKILHSLF